MKTAIVKNVIIDPVSGSEGFSVKVEWRYSTQPNWNIASYSSKVFPSGVLETPVIISFDENISYGIIIRITYLGCSNPQPYYIEFVADAPPTTTTTTTTTTTLPPVIRGTIDAHLTDAEDHGGPVTLLLTFENPIPFPITFKWGYDIRPDVFGVFYLPVSVKYPPAPHYQQAGCVTWEHPSSVTLTTGQTSLTVDSYCAGEVNAHTPNYVDRIVFYSISGMNGYTFDLTPVRNTLTFEIR